MGTVLVAMIVAEYRVVLGPQDSPPDAARFIPFPCCWMVGDRGTIRLARSVRGLLYPDDDDDAVVVSP